jgi:hypothetical protein
LEKKNKIEKVVLTKVCGDFKDFKTKESGPNYPVYWEI